MKKQSWMVIIAGPNGAGKSTFYHQILKKDPLFKNAQFINLDEYVQEMVLENGGIEDDYFIAAGRKVKQNINNNFKRNKSFVYETTSSGLSHLKIMDEAKNKGYKIATIFIGLSKVELSHLRVQKRVEEGGHPVASEDIERRFPKVIKNFPDMLARSDIAAVFDNSGKDPYKLIFMMDKYHFRVFYSYPRWVKEATKGRSTSKNFIFVNANKIKENKKDFFVKIAKQLFLNTK